MENYTAQLKAMTARLVFERVIEKTARDRRLSDDEIIEILTSKMKTATNLVDSLKSDVDKIEYYRANNSEQFELLKNNPSLIEIARDYAQTAVMAAFIKDAKDTIEWVNDPDFTLELYMSIFAS